MSTIVFNSTCKGSSHIVKNQPCQDRSFSESMDQNGLADIIIVSDGHGGLKHFRSDRGAEAAISVAYESICEFVKNYNLSSNSSFVQRGIEGVVDVESPDYTEYDNDNEKIFRQLFRFIIAKWFDKVSADWKSFPPDETEYQNCGGYDQDYYLKGNNFLKAYGCTLMAAVRTKDYWFAFHLGDGKCIGFDDEGFFFEPIPWDSTCFLNVTTSLCSEKEGHFRYCYGKQPLPAIFLGSDGIDDSYVTLDNLASFYKHILLMMKQNEGQESLTALSDFLPILSENGSKDDISLAFWIDKDKLQTLTDSLSL